MHRPRDSLSTNQDGSSATSRVTTVITDYGVAVLPQGASNPADHLPGTGHTALFLVRNTSTVAATLDLTASGESPTLLAIEAVQGNGITGDGASGAVTLGAGDSVSATGWLDIRRVMPILSLQRSVSPNGAVAPGALLTHTLTVQNTGQSTADNVELTDQVPATLAFRIGSVSTSLPDGLTASIAYSNDDGTTWTYSPVSGGCSAAPGYDACVRRIRWTLSGALAPGVSAATLQFQARVQ